MKNRSDVESSRLVDTKVLVIEFLGTFALTYVGSWAIIFKDLNKISNNGVALAHSLAVLVFMWFGIPISGGHFNPAITLGLIVVKRIDWTSAIFYIMAQFLGAIVGAGFIFIQLSTEISDSLKNASLLGIPTPGSANYEISGFWGEAIGTFFIMYIYMALVVDSNRRKTEGVGAAAFAFAVYISSMTLGEISGAGLNPARSLGPAIVAGRIAKMQFIHFFGPIIGAILATIIYNSIFIDDEDDIRDELQSKQESQENNRILDQNKPVHEQYQIELNERQV